MMSRLLLARALLAPSVLWCSLALAAPPPSSADRAALPGTAELQLGVGSAIGLYGATVGYRLAGPFDLEAGIGVGATGLQLSLMPKLKFGSVHDHFVVGIGLSYADPLSTLEPAQGDIGLVWLNADVLGYEHRADDGLVLSASAGVTTCLTEAETRSLLFDMKWGGYTTMQFRIGVGFGF